MVTEVAAGVVEPAAAAVVVAAAAAVVVVGDDAAEHWPSVQVNRILEAAPREEAGCAVRLLRLRCAVVRPPGPAAR